MKKIINTKNAPEPVGPYSQAVACGDFIFCSGQIALDPVTGVLVSYGIAEQAKQVMQNLEAVLKEAGSGFDKVVKSTIYVTNMNFFHLVNEIYGSYFPVDPPARSTVEVKSLPKGALVEIDLICYK